MKYTEKIVRAILAPVLRVLKITWSEERWETVIQFAKFSIVGFTNVAISYVINMAVLFTEQKLFPGFEYDYIVANIAAFMLSVLWSWYLNSKRVFDAELSSTSDKIRSLVKTYITYSFSELILYNLLSTLWIKVLGIPKPLAPILNIPITVPVNFLIMKYWTFSRGKQEQPVTEERND